MEMQLMAVAEKQNMIRLSGLDIEASEKSAILDD